MKDHERGTKERAVGVRGVKKNVGRKGMGDDKRVIKNKVINVRSGWLEIAFTD